MNEPNILGALLMSRRHLRSYVWSLGIALLLATGLWSAVAVIIMHNRGALRANALTNAMSGSRVFAEHVRRTVTMIDLALKDYRDHHHEHPDAPVGEGWRDAYLKEGGVFQMGVIGADGFLAYTNLAPVTKPVYLGDREHFVVHRDGGDDTLFISKPVFGRVSQRWAIQFTRRLARPDGSFAGVVVLSVGPDYFSTNFEALDTGRHGVTLLAGIDRVVRARYTPLENGTLIIGDVLPAGYPSFEPSGPVAGTLERSLADGMATRAAWRRITGYPMVVAVEAADPDVLEQAAGVESRLLWIGALVTAALLAGGLVIGVLLARRAETQRQLERQAQELRIAGEEVERLAYVAAHDLQEPLRAMASFSQLVARTYADRLDAEGRTWLGEIMSGAARMKQLMRDIQFYLAEKSLPLPEHPIAAGHALGAALARFGTAIVDAGAEVEVGPMPAVMADQRRLTEVFSVLLGNALEYRAPDRPLRVRVGVRQEGKFHVFEVADNGIGIEAAYLERIFGVFERLHGRGEHPGTGIGLAIARKMVERLGGTLTVTSTPGVGSTFSVRLPQSPSTGAE